MSRSKKLSPVIDLAQKATEAELALLGEANARFQQEQRQLQDLSQYRDEYLSRFRNGEQTAMTAKKALELRGFLAQLDQAIHAQQLQVEQSRRQLQLQQQNWLNARHKEQAMDTLLARYQADELKQQQRREQRDTDEQTQAMWLRNKRD